MKKFFFLFSYFTFHISYFSFAQNLYDLNNSLLFAEYLTKTKQYNFAAQEYERILFLNHDNDTIKLNLISSYKKAGNYSQGIFRTEELYKNISDLPNSLAIEYSKLLLLNDSFNKAKQFLSLNNNLTSEEKLIMQLNAELLNRKWSTANQLFNKGYMDTTKFHLLSEYKKIIDEGINLKYKSPALALGFSAIVPGAGKFYTKDWKDGLIALITVGASAWQAYTGFYKKGLNSTYGWIYGGIGIGFYTGNLYGSLKAAKKYNQRINEKVHKKAQEIFNKDL